MTNHPNRSNAATLNATEIAHIRTLVNQRLLELERIKTPSPELQSRDIEYSQLIGIDQTLSDMDEELGS